MNLVDLENFATENGCSQETAVRFTIYIVKRGMQDSGIPYLLQWVERFKRHEEFHYSDSVGQAILKTI